MESLPFLNFLQFIRRCFKAQFVKYDLNNKHPSNQAYHQALHALFHVRIQIFPSKVKADGMLTIG